MRRGGGGANLRLGKYRLLDSLLLVVVVVCLRLPPMSAAATMSPSTPITAYRDESRSAGVVNNGSLSPSGWHPTTTAARDGGSIGGASGREAESLCPGWRH